MRAKLEWSDVRMLRTLIDLVITLTSKSWLSLASELELSGSDTEEKEDDLVLTKS